MNCPDVRTRLPGLLYGDLDTKEEATVEEHLTNCPACRKEHADLERVRQALANVPVPPVAVELPQLYQQAALRQARQARRRRRAALALGAAAALFLVAVILRLEVRLEAQQLVFRWGPTALEKTRPAAATEPQRRHDPPLPPQAARPRPAPELEERLRVLGESIHALAGDLEERDERHQEKFVQLQAALEALQQRASRQWSETERNVAALYAAQFPFTKKGDGP